MENIKINILDLTYEELEKFVSIDLGMKAFKAKQIFKWLHQKNLRKLDNMTDLSIAEREKLTSHAYMSYFETLENQVSKRDGTEKFLFQLTDGNTIESVLIQHKDRNTVCVSTQVGCPVQCAFCASGLAGFKRNLELNEILTQVYTINSKLLKQDKFVTNIVFMGMGEPMLNLDTVLKSIYILSSPDGLNISKRKIVISTSGIISGIDRLIEEDIPVELAISLHAADDEKRNQIIPINRKYPLSDLFTMLKAYQKFTNRRITFEYVLIKDFNCSETDADNLYNLLKGLDHTLNLIPLNPVKESALDRPSYQKVVKFFNYLKNMKKLNVTLRKEKGKDIDGACGQLREKHGR